MNHYDCFAFVLSDTEQKYLELWAMKTVLQIKSLPNSSACQVGNASALLSTWKRMIIYLIACVDQLLPFFTS
jgi:hypothetical protein